jgi:hypothetical protein
MRRDAGSANRVGVLLEHLPDNLLAQAFSGHHVSPVHRSKNTTICDAGPRGPGIDGHLNPSRHRHRANTTMLALIDDAPATVALLDVSERERGNLRPSKATVEEND